jgi:hypothetical protein
MTEPSMLAIITAVLARHRLTWHGGGTGVSALCHCHNWKRKTKDLNETYAAHEVHLAQCIEKALGGEE